MRKPANLLRAGVVFAVAAWGGVATAQEAPERPLNRVADGNFESGFVSLRLPPDAPLPMFWGGWVSRGRRVPLMPANDSFDDGRSLRIVATASDPVQVMQDLPVNGRGYGARFAFLIEEGEQSVRLLQRGGDGRLDTARPAFEATISTERMRFTTPDGSWEIVVPVTPGAWHVLSVVADPRTGAQSVRLDGAPLIALPGVAPGRATTLMLGGVAGERGVFRYDAIEIVSLTDLEMMIAREAADRLDEPLRATIRARLSAAATALERGSHVLALPELTVARGLLRGSAPELVNAGRVLDDLIDLVEADETRFESSTRGEVGV